MTQLPTSLFLVEKRTRVATPTGNSFVVTIPPAFVRSLEALGERRLRAAVLRNYLIYTPLPFVMPEKRQLLDLAMTALEALATLDSDARLRGVWRILKKIEDEYEARGGQ